MQAVTKNSELARACGSAAARSRLLAISIFVAAAGQFGRASDVFASDCDETSLRLAIGANAIVHLQCDGKILLSAPLVIQRETVIDGSGQNVTISGQNRMRVFEVVAGAKLTLIGLTVTEGWSTNGGGLLNDGAVVLSNCTFTANTAMGVGPLPGSTSGLDAQGGAILNRGSMSISCSTFFGNEAKGGAGGPVPFLMNAPSGSAGLGGAIANFAELTIANSTLTGNFSRGGAGADGTSGVFGPPCDSPQASLTNGGLGGNGGDAAGGGIFCGGGATILESCTIASNTIAAGAPGNGGAAGACITYVPFPPFSETHPGAAGAPGDAGSCHGGGIAIAGGNFRLRNTLVAGNRGDARSGDIFGIATSDGHNLVSAADGAAGWINNDLTGTLSSPLDAKLGSFGKNGGTTFTIRLRADSPAVDRGAASLSTDQRGEPRPVLRMALSAGADSDGSDIGAYELEEFRLASIATTDSGLTLSFQSDPGLIYRIECTTNLNPAVWSSLLPDIVATGEAIQVTKQIDRATMQQFFRSRIVPPQ